MKKDVTMGFWTAVKVGIGFTVGAILTMPIIALVGFILSLFGLAFSNF